MLRLSSQWTVLFFVLRWVEIGQKFNEKAGEKLSKKIGWKTRENAGDLYYSAVDNFDFTRKIVKKIFGWKLVKMLRFWTLQLLTTLIPRVGVFDIW